MLQVSKLNQDPCSPGMLQGQGPLGGALQVLRYQRGASEGGAQLAFEEFQEGLEPMRERGSPGRAAEVARQVRPSFQGGDRDWFPGIED